jgi:hypothetical protein
MVKPWADRVLDNDVKGATVAMMAEIDELRAENVALHANRHVREDVISELKDELDKLKNQEPVAWCFFRPGISKVDVWKHGGDWQPLYLAAGAQPKEPS